MAHDVRLFDIVNGFFNRCRGDTALVLSAFPQGDDGRIDAYRTQQDYLAEFNNHIILTT
ncbi:hypothetical protein [Sphingobium sp. Z007]|uniref:hypothetical protein n=1 Tax=Sphingobium sp. Z007 TaxID=627495 RepID=UPI001C533717|nr:hypothetical protein [Sphingobium sp. Z007]